MREWPRKPILSSALMSSGKAKSKRYTQLHWAYCGFWEHPRVSLGAGCLMPSSWFAWFQSLFPLVKSVGEDSLLAVPDQNSGSFLESPVHSPSFHQGYYCIDKQISLGETKLDMCISNGKARSALGGLKKEPRVIWAGVKAASHGGIIRIKQDDMYFALRIFNHLFNNLRVQH